MQVLRCASPWYFFLLLTSLPMLPFSFFFFYGSGDHPDLHSFPTRRSSDLAVVADGGAVDRARDAHTDGRRHGKGHRSEETRLNSSHSSISYAVFCLKKKKDSEGFAARAGTGEYRLADRRRAYSSRRRRVPR